MLAVLLSLGVAGWVMMLVGRLILSRAHDRSRRRMARRHQRNEARMKAELAHVDTRYELQQVRLDQAKDRIDHWRTRFGGHPRAFEKHRRGRHPRGRRA
jgi:hypothetical protein